MLNLDPIRARVTAAVGGGDWYTAEETRLDTEAEREFVASAPKDVLSLIAEVERLRSAPTPNPFNPKLGTAPEARAMILTAAQAIEDWNREQHARHGMPQGMTCSFATISTCALPVVLERHEMAHNTASPPTMLGLVITIDDTLPLGEFKITADA